MSRNDHRTVRPRRGSVVGRAASAAVEALEGRRLFSTAYALFGSGGTILAKFDTATPGTIDAAVAVTGLGTGVQLRGIDVRPATGQLFALGIRPTSGDDEGYVYTIDPSTGAATQIGAGPFSTSLLAGAAYAFDFNPAADRIRITNDDDANLRVNPNTGALVQFDTPLTNAMFDEEVTGGAYTNNVNDVQPAGTPAPPTTLFGIDFINDTLVRIGGIDGAAGSGGTPNAGLVTTIGPLGFTTNTAANGFDVAQDGTPYAALQNRDTGLTSLYTIDLATGAATAVGTIGNGAEVVRGFTVAPDDVPPDADPDAYAVAAGGTLTVDAADGVLANDVDPELAPLTAERITQPANGTLTLNADGSFAYTPNPGFVGTDSFTYVANDGTSDGQSTLVTLDVTAALSVNDRAVAEGNGGTKVLSFTVSLSAPAPAGGVSVTVRTQANTAAAGSDYASVAATVLSFAAGETTKTVNVTVVGDAKKEADESFYVRLSDAAGAALADDTGVGTILNDDGGGKPAKPKGAVAATTSFVAVPLTGVAPLTAKADAEEETGVVSYIA